MVNKIATPPTTSELIGTVNEIIDGKQDVLTAGTGISIVGNVISNTQTSANWGNITGVLSNQIDLQNALNLKANIADIPTTTSDLTNDSGFITSSALAPYVLSADLASVATSGSYDDLINKPTIPSAVTEATVSGWGFTKNTGTVTSVNNVSPVNGNVTLSIPTVPTNISAFTNDIGYITSSALNGYATENWVNNQGYLTGITSSDVTSALGYTPYNATNPNGYITSSALSGYQTTSNLVTSVSSSSTDSQYPSAKLFYDTCGDIETLINAL